MKQVSTKQARRLRAYHAQRKVFLESRPWCEIRWDDSCMGRATEVSHMQGRIGDRLLNEEYWMAACHSCGQAVHHHPEEAIERGFTVRRVD